jgi:hypothetical protein
MNIIVPIAVALLFFLIKILEMKYIHKEWKPIKYIIRDTFFVFSSSFVVTLAHDNFKTPIQEFMDVLTNTKTAVPVSHPEVFTDLPGF